MDFRYNFPTTPKANPKAIVGGRGNKFRFTVLTSHLLRYEWSEDGRFEDRASTFAVSREFLLVDFRVIDEPDNLEIITDHFHLTYNKQAFTPEGLTVTVNGTDTWRYDGQSYGDLGGTARTLDQANGRIPLEPGILSRKAYAVLDDSESMLFDDNGWIASRVPGRKDGYVFAYNGQHKEAMWAFYRLSGPQPLLPRWALGNWWSRYHAYSDIEYLTLVDRFEKEGIPLVVGVIDMDWHRVEVPKKYGSGWTGYTWNSELFPDPGRFLQDLHERGLKVALNDHPADGIRAFEDLYEAVAKYLGFDTSHEDPIKFDPTDRKFLDAYFDVLKAKFEKQGLDFWWIDWQQGNKTKIPGIDPLWVLNHYHYLNSLKDLKNLEKPITFSRFAGPGSHRYPIGFSGDTFISWPSLDFQPEFTATASNIGYGWWSHDIGGHFWGTRSNERLARWVQLGTFSPILRLHSEKSQWNGKEPWNYEPETYDVMKQFLILRHRLLPFLYTMNVRASYKSLPLVQPMYWNHADDLAYTVPNQYYFGPDLIVAPITSPHSPATLLGATQAWLPAGRFVDLFNPGLVYDGDRELKFHRTLSQMPVLAKEGTILPVDASAELGNSTANPSVIEVILAVGADGKFELVEEDEDVPREARPDPDSFIRTPIVWEQNIGKLTIGPRSKKAGKKRTWLLKLLGHTSTDFSGLLPPEYVTKKDHSTMIKLGTILPSGKLTIRLGEDLQLDVVDMPARVHEVLYRAETEHQPKETVWQLVTQSKAPLYVRQNQLNEMAIDQDLKDAVLEVWLADERALAKQSHAQSSSLLRPSLSTRSTNSDGSYVVL